MCDSTLAQVLVHASPHPHSHPCVMRLSDCLFSPFPHLVLFRVFLLSLLLLPGPGLLPFPLPCSLHRGKIPLALRQFRSLALWPIICLSQVMSPTSSTISTTQRPLKSSSRSNPATRCPRTCMTRSSVGRALSSPLFIQEREEPASRRQAYHSHEESLLPTQSLSVCHARTGGPVNEFGSQISNVRENPCRDSENEQIKIHLDRQKSKFSLIVEQRFRNTNFQADYDRRSSQKLNEVIVSQREELYRAHQGDEQLRPDQHFLHEQLLEQNRDLREAHMKSLNEMEELKRFQESMFEEKIDRRSRYYP